MMKCTEGIPLVRRLDGKVAIVTGAGIGEAIAHKFAKEGVSVIINGLADDPIEDDKVKSL
ncbi:MAG: hypothetical protein MET45_07540 [Nostoc sp. LLA-1]|nr:hypothetical protein [Cyanocohniella sp. LLY]